MPTNGSPIRGVHTGAIRSDHHGGGWEMRGPEDAVIRHEEHQINYALKHVDLPLCLSARLPEGTTCSTRIRSEGGIFFLRRP